MNILLTNDDGIHSEGIRYLFEGLKGIAELAIVAPAQEQSGRSLAITTRRPLEVERVSWPDCSQVWSVNGTPADCVKMALAVLLEKKPTLICSGINHGSNAGGNVLYSGTIGGVIEGALRGIPGIAFSCFDLFEPNFLLASQHVARIVKHVLETPLPMGTFLNVNFPSSSHTAVQGFRLARQGKSYWLENPECRKHPMGKNYYWLGGTHVEFEEKPDSDIHFLSQGYITAVPIHVGELTDHTHLEERQASFEALFTPPL